MAILKCKMCGGNLEITEGMTVCECEYCGSKQTVPSVDNEKKITLFTRANRLRAACEFDKASGVYESIVTEFSEEAEAYWGLVLCKFGIEYVDDPKTGKKIPTCHRSSFDSVLEDSDFEMVMEYSDVASRSVYREEAKAIENLRVGIIGVSSKEEPYDIFICYKETDPNGDRTIDSVIAQDVYDALIEKGYRVFFSRITLEDRLGEEYEPYIFAALNSAKVMLAFGTDYEYYNAVWVKNEWNRFLSLIEKGDKKTLIPCYKGIDAYDMPKEFARLQAQDMGKVGAIQDLVRGIGKILGSKTAPTNNFAVPVSAEGSALTQRGTMALEDGDFEGAEGYFERALDVNPSDAKAYLGKFLAFHKLTSLADWEDKVVLMDEDKEFKRAEQFADPALAKELKEAKEFNEIKIQRLRILDVLRKHRKNAVNNYYSEKKKEAYEKLMSQSPDGELVAREIFSELVAQELISSNTAEKLVKNTEIIGEVANVLGDCEMHSSSAIFTEGSLSRYSRFSVSTVLKDLVEFGLIEAHDLGYCLIGAKEEKERIIREAEERRQKEARKKAAFDVAVAKVNSKISSELESERKAITVEAEAKKQPIIAAMNSKIQEVNSQRTKLDDQRRDLERQRASLGFFKGKQKAALAEQIELLDSQINNLSTEQAIRQEFQPQINLIDNDVRNKIKAAEEKIRGKYIMPKLEDFAEN